MPKWVKGQSGNPRGRPRRGQSFADALRKVLRERDPETRQSLLEQLARAAVERARRGDIEALRFIVERIDGKVPDAVNTQGELRIRVEYADVDDTVTETPSESTGRDS